MSEISQLLALWKAEDARLARQIEIDQGGFDQVSKRTHVEQLRLLRERTTALDTALSTQGLTAADLNAAASACEAQGNIQNLRQSEQQGLATVRCTWGNRWKALATKFAGLALPPDPPQGKEPLRSSIEHVLSVFKKDEAQGYHNRDRQFAIEILEKALGAAASPPAQEQELRTRAEHWLNHASGNLPGWGNEPAKPIELVRDLLAALPPAHGWQPIETAPKNFMPVLLVWHPPVGRPDPVVVLARWGCRTHLHLSKWHDCPNHPDCQMQWDSYAGEMSHWMPLPAPPIAHGWHAEKEKP